MRSSAKKQVAAGMESHVSFVLMMCRYSQLNRHIRMKVKQSARVAASLAFSLYPKLREVA